MRSYTEDYHHIEPYSLRCYVLKHIKFSLLGHRLRGQGQVQDLTKRAVENGHH